MNGSPIRRRVSQPPFGFRIEAGNSAMQVDPVATPVIAEAFARYVRGESCSTIGAWMNSSAAPNSSPAKTRTWDGRAVRSLLGNPLYKGLVTRTTRPASEPDESPPISAGLAHVDTALWEAANERLQSERLKSPPPSEG